MQLCYRPSEVMRMRGGDRRSDKRFGPNALGYKLNCVQCGSPFWTSRPDALYDNVRCRNAAARERAKYAHASKPKPPVKKKPTKKPTKKKKTGKK